MNKKKTIDFLYLSHIQRVVSIVRKIRPGIRILIWDDVLRNDQLISNQILVKFHLNFFFLD